MVENKSGEEPLQIVEKNLFSSDGEENELFRLQFLIQIAREYSLSLRALGEILINSKDAKVREAGEFLKNNYYQQYLDKILSQTETNSSLDIGDVNVYTSIDDDVL